MAGASIRIELDDREAQAKLSRMIALGQDMSVLLADIGKHLELSTDARFDRREAPDGSPWAEVSPAYAALKREGSAAKKGLSGDRRPENILELSRHLRGGLRFQIEGDELLFGTDRKYGATHQFGAPDRGIVARRFLGISGVDSTEIIRLMSDYISAP